jgi:hypothetical protein
MKRRLLNCLTHGLIIVGACALVASACASDNDGEPSEGDGTGGGAAATGGGGGDDIVIPPRGSGSIYDDLDIEDPEPAEFYFEDVPAAYEDVEGCKAFESAYPDVHSCSCDNCFEVQRQCDSLEGCREISECGIAIGCQDAFDCYLAPMAGNEMCIPIIDKWGNTGVSAALSLQLGACTVAAGCRDIPE